MAGLERATAEKWDLVMSDIGLPDMNGFTLARRLRQAGIDVPLLALSGFDTDDDRKLGLASGFDAYLTKPINFEALCMLVDHVAGIKRQRDDSAAWTGSPPTPSVASFEKPRPATARNTADQGEP